MVPSEIGKYTSQHGASTAARHFIRELEEQGNAFNVFNFNTKNFPIYSIVLTHTCTSVTSPPPSPHSHPHIHTPPALWRPDVPPGPPQRLPSPSLTERAPPNELAVHDRATRSGSSPAVFPAATAAPSTAVRLPGWQGHPACGEEREDEVRWR